MAAIFGRIKLAWFITVSAVLLLGTILPAQEQMQPERRVVNSPRPWQCDLLLFTSRDGQTFARSKVFVQGAGVASVIRDARNRLIAVFQWFPSDRREAFDKVAAAFSEDDGASWSQPEPIQVEGLPEGAQRPFDPTIVLLESGKLRLYFTCTTPARREPAIYSAISGDGRAYRFEPGARFGVEGEKVVDAAVTRLGRTWHLFSPMEPPVHEARLATAAAGSNQGGVRRGPSAGGYHAISEDGLNFRRVEDAVVPVRGSWIGNVIARGNQLHFYGSGADQGWLAQSADGKDWKLTSTALRVGGDPAPIQLGDDQFLIIATGPPRAGAKRPAWLPEPQDNPRPAIPLRREYPDLRRVL